MARYTVVRRVRQPEPAEGFRAYAPAPLAIVEASSRKRAQADYLLQSSLARPGEETVLGDNQTGEQISIFYVATQEERAARAQDSLTLFIHGFCKEGVTDLTEVAEKFIRSAQDADADPTYDFQWLDGRFMGAARLLVGRKLAAYRGRMTLAALLEMASAEVHRGARSPSRSTSVTHNLMEQCKTAAWAEAQEKLVELVADTAAEGGAK